MATLLTWGFEMDFAERIAALRKAKAWTQQELANRTGLSVIQLHRYEKGTSQPSLDAIKKLALALSTTSDDLVFGKDERGPDEDLRLQFETISRFDPEAKKLILEVLDSLILKQEARRWSGARAPGP